MTVGNTPQIKHIENGYISMNHEMKVDGQKVTILSNVCMLVNNDMILDYLK